MRQTAGESGQQGWDGGGRGEASAGASGLGALTYAWEAYVETGVEALLACCQGPSEGLFPTGR